MKRLLALLIACLALTLVACGDDDDDDGGASGGATTETATTPAPEPAGDASVDIPDISFDPAKLTVKKGTTVTWTNSDDLPHTVTKDDGPGPDFDSGTMNEGDEFDQTFDTKGTIEYVCTIHSGQKGSITVE
jgi:plastocyanin